MLDARSSAAVRARVPRACVLGNEGSAGAAGAQGLSRAHIHGVDELSIGLLHHVDGLLASVGTELSDQPVSGRLVSEACQTALDDQVGPRGFAIFGAMRMYLCGVPLGLLHDLVVQQFGNRR